MSNGYLIYSYSKNIDYSGGVPVAARRIRAASSMTLTLPATSSFISSKTNFLIKARRRNFFVTWEERGGGGRYRYNSVIRTGEQEDFGRGLGK